LYDFINKKWICVDLEVIEYKKALNLQRELVALRKREVIDTDVVLLLEHPAVFTLGRRGGVKNLKVSKDFLNRLKIPIIQVERGGNITFHGPGQLVVYPIIDLKKAELQVLDHIENLEEVMIRVTADWGIEAERNSTNRGIWINNNKLGSVGISVQRDICFHGFALNVNVSLKPFGWINPCGLQDIQVTSMEKELLKQVSMRQVREAVKHHITEIYGVSLVIKTSQEMQRTLTRISH
jgi:lipoate-protein ligase B